MTPLSSFGFWFVKYNTPFIDTQLWPPRTHVDPRGWLENFFPDEMDHAAHLLNAVVYLNEPLVERLFASAFHGLTRHLGCPNDRFPASQARWQRFLDDVHVTPVAGEAPGPTDSGNLFARKTRKLVGIPDERILDNAAVLEQVLSGAATEVVFVDDFVGSGSQLSKTWHRVHHIGSTATSFAELSRDGLARFFYCPVFCTQYALDNGLKSLMVRSAGLERPQLVADFAAGDGGLLRAARNRWPAAAVVATDCRPRRPRRLNCYLSDYTRRGTAWSLSTGAHAPLT